MATSVKGYIKTGTLDQLKERGCLVVTGGGHVIAVFHHEGEVYAVDNRCPHMGFPSTGAASRMASSPATGTMPGSTCPAAAPSIPSPMMCGASR